MPQVLLQGDGVGGDVRDDLQGEGVIEVGQRQARQVAALRVHPGPLPPPFPEPARHATRVTARTNAQLHGPKSDSSVRTHHETWQQPMEIGKAAQ
jgi:hypothetical protein